MINLGSVCEFHSDHWKGRIFGKVDAIYVDIEGKPKEYWVEHIDNADFRPDQLVRIVEEGKDWMPPRPNPKFKIGDVVKHHDGEKNWLLVIKDAECRIDNAGCEWWYFFEEKCYLGNEVPWDEPCREETLKRFKV